MATEPDINTATLEASAPPAIEQKLDWNLLFSDIGAVEKNLPGDRGPRLGVLLENVADRDEMKARIITTSWMRERYPQIKRSIFKNNWDALKRKFAKEYFGLDKPDITDLELYNAIGGEMRKKNEEEEKVVETLQKMQQSAIAGEADWSKALEAAGGIEISPRRRDRYMVAMAVAYQGMRAKADALRPLGDNAATLLERWANLEHDSMGTGVMSPEWKAVKEKRKAIRDEMSVVMDTLSEMPEEDRRFVYQIIAHTANPRDKDFAEQSLQTVKRNLDALLRHYEITLGGAGNRLETVARGRNATLNSAVNRREGESIIDYFERASWANRGIADFLLEPVMAPSKPRRATDDEMAEFRREAARVRTRHDVANEIRKVSENVIDPIKAGNWITEKIWYPALQSAPYMAQAFVPYAGIPLLLTSTAGMRAEEAMERGVSAEDAMTIGVVTAVPETVIELFQAKLFLGKIPGLSKAFEIPASTMRKWLARSAVTLGAELAGETATEVAQDATSLAVQHIGHALKEAIPGVDWGDYHNNFWMNFGDTGLAMLPMVLIGTGAASFRDARYLKDWRVLTGVGFKADIVDRIINAPTPLESQLLIQAYFNDPKARDPNSAAAKEARAQIAAKLETRLQSLQQGAKILKMRDGTYTVAGVDGKNIATGIQSADAASEIKRNYDENDAQKGEQERQIAGSLAGLRDDAFWAPGQQAEGAATEAAAIEFEAETDGEKIDRVSKLGAQDSAVPVAVKPSVAAGGDSAKLAAFVAEFEGTFGRKVVFFRDESGVLDGPDVPAGQKRNGFIKDDDPSTIYVNANSPAPARAIIGHEFGHSMEKTHGAVWKTVRDLVMKMTPYSEAYAEKRRAQGYSDGRVVNEWVSDVLGQHFDNAAFWRKLGEVAERHGKGAEFRSFVQAVLDWLNDLIDRMRVARAGGMVLDSEAHEAALMEAEGLREGIANALVQISEPANSKSQTGDAAGTAAPGTDAGAASEEQTADDDGAGSVPRTEAEAAAAVRAAIDELGQGESEVQAAGDVTEQTGETDGAGADENAGFESEEDSAYTQPDDGNPFSTGAEPAEGEPVPVAAFKSGELRMPLDRGNPKASLQWAIANLRGVKTNRQTGWRIALTREVFSHSYNHAKANLDKFRVVEMLPELVVNGVAFDGGAPYAGGRKGVEKTHMLFAPFILNGETHVAEIIIHQYGAESTATGTDKQAYNIKSVKIKNLGAGTGLAPSPALTSLRHSQDSMSIGELAGLVKSAWPDAKMDGLQASTGAEPAAQAKLTRVLASFMFNRFINELRGAAEASGERLADAQLRFGDQDAGMDLLDVIEAHGGVKSPAAMKNPGGEYDGFAGAFGRGAARRLVRRNGGGSAVDVLIEELRESGYNFESADAFYEAVAYAVRLREEKRANAKALKKEERREAGRLRKMDNVGSRMASLTAAAVKEFGITVNGRTRNAVERAGRIAARAVRVWKAGGGNADAAFDAIAEMTRPVTPASAVKNQVRRATGQVEDTITITAQEALRRLYAAEARAAKAAARMTQQELTALKRTLANEVAAALPLAERGKFLKAIANVKDEKHLKRQLERLKVAVAVADKRAAVQELRKMIKRLPDIDKMRPEYARKVEAVLDAIDTGKMTEKTRRELESMKKYILENPNNEVPADEIERLARLDKTSVADMTAEEVRAKVALLAMYVAQNALKNKLLAGQRARVYAVMKAAMLGELAGKTDLEDRALGIRKGLAAVGRVLGGSGEVAPNIERSVMQKYFGEFSTRPEQLLAEVGESFRELVWENIGVQGWRRELELTQREQDKVFARMRAAGLPFGPGASRAENKAFSDWLNTRVEVTLGGRKARLRMGEAVYIYELSLDPDRRDRLVNTKGLRVERLGARAVYKPDEAELDALPGVIGAEGLALAEAHRETYNGELRRDLNKEWVDVHFHEVAPNTDYTPSRADSLSRRKTIDEMVRENRAISIEGRGMFKPRDNSATAGLLIRDAMAVWEEHLTATAKATAYLKAQHDFNVLMSDPDIQREMTAKYGEDFLRYLKNKVIDQVMGMRPNADLNAAETFVRGLLGRAAVSALSLRISTPLLNFASLPLSATWLKNPLRMARAAAEVPARAGERERIEKAALRFSPYFRARYEGFFKNITSGLFGESETTYGVKPLTEYGLAGIEATDRLCGLIRWRAIELDLRASRKDLKPGTDAFYREVAQEWERMMYRTENTSHAMEMSGFIEMGRKNPMAAGLALFQSASSKLYSNARRAVWLAARGEKRAAAVVFGGVSLAIAAAALIRAAIHEAQGDDDDDKKKAGLAVTAATEALSILPVGGEVAGGMVRSLSTGRNAFTGRTVTGDFAGAVTGVGLGVIKTGSALLEGNSDSKGNPEWHKDAKKLAENTTKAVALSTGLPYGGVEQIGKIGLNVFGGKTADEVMDEIIKEKGLDPSDEIDSKAVSVQRNNAFRAITRGDQSGFDRAALGVVEAGGDVSFPAFFNDLKRRHDKVLTIKSRLGADTELLGADARALIDAEWASFEAEVEVLRGLYGNLPAEVREAWEKKMTERLKIGE